MLDTAEIAAGVFSILGGGALFSGGVAISSSGVGTLAGAAAMAAGAGLVTVGTGLVGGGVYNLNKDIQDIMQKFSENGSGGTKITRSNHAEIRATQGRNVQNVVNDVQKARPSDILRQDDGRWVVRGNNGRVHILEENGELVTTMNKVTKQNTIKRINSGRWSRLSNKEEKLFQEQFRNYVNW